MSGTGTQLDVVSARAARRQQSTQWWLMYGCVGAFAAVVAVMAVGTAPELFSLVFLLLVVSCGAALVRPALGVYALVFFTLVGDIITTPWWPFTKNMSSRESAFFISDGLSISPYEVVLGVTLASFLVRRLGDPAWTFRRGRLFTPMLVFTAFVVVGLFYGLATGGDTRAALFEVRPLLYVPVVYVLVTNLFTTRLQYQRLLLIAFAGVSVQSIFSLSYYRSLTDAQREALESLSEHSATIHMNALVCCLLGVWLMRGRRWVLATLVLLAPPVVYAYILSQRRAAMIALALGVVMLTVVLYHRRRRAFWWFTPIALVVVAVFVAATWNASGALGLPATAVKSVIAPGQLSEKDQSSDLYRQIEAYDLWYTVRRHPLLGIGFGQKFEVPVKLPDIGFFEFWQYLPHNAIIWLYLKTGLLGIISFFVMVGRAIQLGTRSAMNLVSPDAAITVLTGVLYIAMFVVYAFVDIAFDVRTTTFLAFTLALCADFEFARAPSPRRAQAQHAPIPRLPSFA